MPCPPMRRLLLALSLIAVAVSPAGAFKRTFKGEALKDFELPGLAGEPLRLNQHLGERATVVIFWASWSPRSAEALGEFQEIYAEHRGVGLQVVAVNVEHQIMDPAQRQSIVTFAANKGLTYPVLVDDGLRVFDAYGVIAVPSLILADAEGRILDLLDGYSNMTRCDFRDRVLVALDLRQPEIEESPEVSVYCPVGKAARYYQMGELFLGKKMTGRAVKALRRAVQEDPNYAEAYVHLAAALELQGEREAAAEARGKAAALGMSSRPPLAAGDLDSPNPGAPEAAPPVDSPGGDAVQGASGISPTAETRGEERGEPLPAGEEKR